VVNISKPKFSSDSSFKKLPYEMSSTDDRRNEENTFFKNAEISRHVDQIDIFNEWSSSKEPNFRGLENEQAGENAKI
jgi:hypothetical protein